jgi:hypothetical protein
MRSIFLAVLLLAAPSFAGLASRPASGDDSPRQSRMEGLYAGLGGGGALLLVGDSNAFGYDAELRLGYSFNPGLQLYLSGSLDGGSFDSSAGGGSVSYRSEMFGAFLQYHLFANGTVGVYGRVGVGIGMSGSLAADNAVGFASAGGLGVEIRIAPDLFLTPELFYKNMSLSVSGSGSTSEQVIGLQLALIYY